jgi:hypothetical protein
MIDVFNIEIGHRPLALSAGLKTPHRPSRASALVRVATDRVATFIPHLLRPIPQRPGLRWRRSLGWVARSGGDAWVATATTIAPPFGQGR